MPITITINGVDRTAKYQIEELNQITVKRIADDGEIGQGSVPIPINADFAVYAGHALKIVHDGVTIIDGWVGSHTYSRGSNVRGRWIKSLALTDDNSLLRGFRTLKWVRPAETTRARFLAFMAAFVPAVTDMTNVTSTPAAVGNMPAKTYGPTEELLDELQQEIKDLTGNTIFLEKRRAHCHPATEGALAGLSITDVNPNYTTSFDPIDAARTTDPHDLGNDLVVKGPKGRVRVTDATSLARHDVDGLKHQRYAEISEGNARAQATVMLNNMRYERTTYECEIGPLTAAQVDLIPVGSLINVTSQVMGLSSSTQRIAALTLRYRHPGKWMASIEMGFPIRNRVKAPRTVPPTLPYQQQDPLEVVQLKAGNGSLTMNNPITAGNTLLYVGGKRAGAFNQLSGLVGYTLVQPQTLNGGGDYVGMFYKVAAASESQTLAIASEGDVGGTWYELPGIWTPDTSDADTGAAGTTLTFVSGPITVAANSMAFACSIAGQGGGWDSIVASHTPGAGWIEDHDAKTVPGHPFVWVGHQTPAAGSLSVSTTIVPVPPLADPADRPAWAMQMAAFIGPLDTPPATGQWVDETVTMVGASGTTRFPFADGSLQVKVDLLDQTAAVTAQSGAAGTFTLGFTPKAGERVDVRYQGR